MTTLPIAFVGQLHGRSVRMCLERVLTPMTEALPGDIVAVRESGLYLDNASFINSSQFLLRTQKGFLQLRLSDLPEKKHRICAEALGASLTSGNSMVISPRSTKGSCSTRTVEPPSRWCGS